MMIRRNMERVMGIALGLLASIGAKAATWDTFPDTWVATDALDRSLPTFTEAGAPRPDRTIGMFYFLWLGPHVNGGPWDITTILAQHPGAMTNRNSPPWGPMHAPHHWGQSIFDYYNSDDPYVLRKHAQMLGDAGVDVIIFDVTNQATYRKNYLALLREFAAVRRNGGRTPQVAFLCPFWNPAKVVNELFHDLYEPGLHSDLWFRWDGKPLILADAAKFGERKTFNEHNVATRLEPGRTLGQSFTAQQPFESVAGFFPTWKNQNSAMTLTLFRDGPEGERVASARFENVSDNASLAVRSPQPLPAGGYYLEMSAARGAIGWWSHAKDRLTGGMAFADRAPAGGDRNLEVTYVSNRAVDLRQFFTFRKPQPDYFQGQTQADMWSWLEVYPQHVFTNALGQKEQMSVGVAQNAVSNRLGSMSEKEARGRSFHGGAFPTDPDAVLRGSNFTEQFERALREDPRFIFVTGWNEWIAGRFDAFGGVRRPVMFVDQFDQEHSRDIEPMRGGHGDNYYYQLVSFLRRYKGVRPSPKAGPAKTIDMQGSFEQWRDVRPEFRDDIGDTAHRDFPGYNNYARLRNTSGRNDFVALKVARDEHHLFFHVQTREPITGLGATNWMMLLLDADHNHRTGWEGYDFAVNRVGPVGGKALLEHNRGGWNWQRTGEIEMRVEANQLVLAIPRKLLGREAARGSLAFDFKWADNVTASGNIVEWLDAGDCAPNGRFNYRFTE
jgi:hypothetical protein